MTKRSEGMLFVLLGIVFYLARPITHINYQEFMSARQSAGENINGRYVTYDSVIVIYETGLLYYLIPLIFIILGAIKIRRSFNEKT